MREYIVFTNREHYNDLGIVRSLGETGIKPVLIAVKGPIRFVGFSKYVKRVHYVNDAEAGVELLLSHYKDMDDRSYILSGNDVINAVIDAHYDDLEDYFYFYNAGKTGRLSYYMDKDNMFQVASKYGVNSARTWKVTVGDVPQDIEYPVMTKAINSLGNEWKNIVYICSNERELKDAYSQIQSDKILLQKYIEKVDEISFQGISVDHGNDVKVLTTMRQEYNIPDKYSPLWIVENNRNTEMLDKIQNILKEIGYEGIFEFEFIKDKQGNLWFLEINFRNAADGYATTVAGVSQVNNWCKSIEQGFISPDVEKPIPEGFKAIAECFDYDVRVKGKKITHREWMKQYKAIQCKLYKGEKDFLPFFVFMLYKLLHKH